MLTKSLKNWKTLQYEVKIGGASRFYEYIEASRRWVSYTEARYKLISYNKRRWCGFLIQTSGHVEHFIYTLETRRQKSTVQNWYYAFSWTHPLQVRGTLANKKWKIKKQALVRATRSNILVIKRLLSDGENRNRSKLLVYFGRKSPFASTLKFSKVNGEERKLFLALMSALPKSTRVW